MVYLDAESSRHDEMQTSEGCRKPFLSFSIERILYGHFRTERERIKRKQENSPTIVDPASSAMPVPKYNWLGYTRYNPPKLPSKFRRLLCKSGYYQYVQAIQESLNFVPKTFTILRILQRKSIK